MVKYAAKGNIINFQNKSGRSDKNRGAFVLILKHGGFMLKHTATKMGIKRMVLNIKSMSTCRS